MSPASGSATRARPRAAGEQAPGPRRRDEARALFRNAILEAAEDVFGERGFHRARIQDVAARARIAVGTVYNHFDDKDEVLRALMEERTEAMLEQFDGRSDDPKSFEQRLAARVERMLRYVEAHRAFFALASEQGIFGASSASAEALGGKAAKNLARARAMFAELIEEGIAAGALAPVEPAKLVRALGGIVRAFALAAVEPGAPGVASDAPLVAHLFVHGASRPQARAPKRPR